MGTFSGYPRLGVFSSLVSQIAWIMILISIVWLVSEIRVQMALSQQQAALVVVEPITNATSPSIEVATCPACPSCATCPPEVIKTVTLPCNKSTCPECPPKPKKFNYDDVECYRFAYKNSTPIDFLEELSVSPRAPTKGNTIFFVETSYANKTKNGTVYLDSRRACAVESAAKAHPDRDVFVLFVTPVGYPQNKSELSPVLDALESYPNIYLRNLYIPYLVKDTPIERWFATGELFTSIYMPEHLSDFLRFTILYKYGGTYFDADFIIQKSLDDLEPNFFGDEHDQITGSSVINFSHEGIGHEMASILLQDFAWRFNGVCWGCNGPILLHNFAARVCGTSNSTLQTREQCVGFEKHLRPVFYPVEAIHWDKLFKSSETKFIFDKVKNAYGIHTWNSHRNYYHIDNEANSPYSILAGKFCPETVAIGTKYFR